MTILRLPVLMGVLIGAALLTTLAQAQTPAPPVPHPVQGQEACTQCHAPSSPLALPDDHTGRPDETCLVCHQPGPSQTATPATPPPNPTATPGPTSEPQTTPIPQATSGPTAVPRATAPPQGVPTAEPPTTYTPQPMPVAVSHPVQGREACTTCHAPSSPLALPDTHGGRADETCLVCHQAVQPTAIPVGTPEKTTPPTAPPSPAAPPPSVAGDLCLGCHGNPNLTMTFANADVVSVAVSEEAFRGSVHGDVLECQDCHVGYEQVPHPTVAMAGTRSAGGATSTTTQRLWTAPTTRR